MKRNLDFLPILGKYNKPIYKRGWQALLFNLLTVLTIMALCSQVLRPKTGLGNCMCQENLYQSICNSRHQTTVVKDIHCTKGVKVMAVFSEFLSLLVEQYRGGPYRSSLPELHSVAKKRGKRDTANPNCYNRNCPIRAEYTLFVV